MKSKRKKKHEQLNGNQININKDKAIMNDATMHVHTRVRITDNMSRIEIKK